jgi:hypothetical protein
MRLFFKFKNHFRNYFLPAGFFAAGFAAGFFAAVAICSHPLFRTFGTSHFDIKLLCANVKQFHALFEIFFKFSV